VIQTLLSKVNDFSKPQAVTDMYTAESGNISEMVLDRDVVNNGPLTGNDIHNNLSNTSSCDDLDRT